MEAFGQQLQAFLPEFLALSTGSQVAVAAVIGTAAYIVLKVVFAVLRLALSVLSFLGGLLPKRAKAQPAYRCVRPAIGSAGGLCAPRRPPPPLLARPPAANRCQPPRPLQHRDRPGHAGAVDAAAAQGRVAEAAAARGGQGQERVRLLAGPAAPVGTGASWVLKQLACTCWLGQARNKLIHPNGVHMLSAGTAPPPTATPPPSSSLPGCAGTAPR